MVPSVQNENGLFLLFERGDVAEGAQVSDYPQFNAIDNGFSVFQSHRATNAVQTYIWPEDVGNHTGYDVEPLTHEQLISSGKSFGIKALFDCVDRLQGQERWWWELSRRCSLQDEHGTPVPKERMCTLEWRQGQPGWSQQYPRAGEKASSHAFEAWFDALRYQMSLNMFKMGIFGSNAESFLCKVRLCYARRDPYCYQSVYTQVEGVPVVYLGDSAGSTDFKKGLSCGRGLICATEFAFDTLGFYQQLASGGQASLKQAFQLGSERYQAKWRSPEMEAEWRHDFDATNKYLLAGRRSSVKMHAPVPSFLHVSQIIAAAGMYSGVQNLALCANLVC